MNLKFTPLFIFSIVTILFGVYYIISGMGGNLGPPAGMIIIALGLLGLLFYFLLRRIYKTNVRRQVITELFLIIIVAFFWYRSNEKIILHVPRTFQGYIMLVYGTDKGLNIQTSNFWNPNIDITVPNSGIIFTTNEHTKNMVVIDSSNGEIKSITPGYGLPFTNDTLYCGNKKYFLDVIVFGNLPTDWDYKKDSVTRNLKKELACKLLNN